MIPHPIRRKMLPMHLYCPVDIVFPIAFQYTCVNLCKWILIPQTSVRIECTIGVLDLKSLVLGLRFVHTL